MVKPGKDRTGYQLLSALPGNWGVTLPSPVWMSTVQNARLCRRILREGNAGGLLSVWFFRLFVDSSSMGPGPLKIIRDRYRHQYSEASLDMLHALVKRMPQIAAGHQGLTFHRLRLQWRVHSKSWRAGAWKNGQIDVARSYLQALEAEGKSPDSPLRGQLQQLALCAIRNKEWQECVDICGKLISAGAGESAKVQYGPGVVRARTVWRCFDPH